MYACTDALYGWGLGVCACDLWSIYQTLALLNFGKKKHGAHFTLENSGTRNVLSTFLLNSDVFLKKKVLLLLRSSINEVTLSSKKKEKMQGKCSDSTVKKRGSYCRPNDITLKMSTYVILSSFPNKTL